MAIEIVDFPSYKMVMDSIVFLYVYQRGIPKILPIIPGLGRSEVTTIYPEILCGPWPR